jgi:hypothetical protein
MSPHPPESARDDQGRWQKGRSGNPQGRPKGTRHHATVLAEQMIDQEAEGVVRRLLDMALAGDATALRLVVERLFPPRRERPVVIDLPPVMRASEAVRAMAEVVAAVAAGDLTPAEGGEISKLLAVHLRALEANELAERIAALEERIAHRGAPR